MITVIMHKAMQFGEWNKMLTLLLVGAVFMPVTVIMEEVLSQMSRKEWCSLECCLYKKKKKAAVAS